MKLRTFDPCKYCGKLLRDIRATRCQPCFWSHYPKRKMSERFFKYVKKTKGCWIWTGTKNRLGYGQMTTYNKGVRRGIASHRFSWEHHNSQIPKGSLVLHKCDNPPCVNPAHLFLGSHQDNVDDKRNKGRMPIGEKCWNAILTEKKVRKIKLLYDGKYGCQVKLANLFGVSRGVIQGVIYGHNWKHIV